VGRSPLGVLQSRAAEPLPIDRLARVGLLVLRTDNAPPRVRDGYISLSACGHARALATLREWAICRTNVISDARACTRLPRQKW